MYVLRSVMIIIRNVKKPRNIQNHCEQNCVYPRNMLKQHWLGLQHQYMAQCCAEIQPSVRCTHSLFWVFSGFLEKLIKIYSQIKFLNHDPLDICRLLPTKIHFQIDMSSYIGLLLSEYFVPSDMKWCIIMPLCEVVDTPFHIQGVRYNFFSIWYK